jgi:hypothetical protein
MAALVVSAIINNSMTSARTAQSNDNQIGASELGMCRSYLQRMILQEEKREEERIPWAAFIGTALGDALEAALMKTDPDIVTQYETETLFPSGRVVPGHVDAFLPAKVVYGDDGMTPSHEEPGWVLDFKAKDGLVVAERGEPDRAHVYQIVSYWLALVQQGLLVPESKAFIVYVDRSGGDSEPIVKEVHVTDHLIDEIDEFVGDAIQAVIDGYEAPRDRPYEWCNIACPFFLNCRGADEMHAEGVITDPEVLTAGAAYQEGLALAREAARLKDGAKPYLEGRSGRIGDHILSWTHVNGTEVAFTRPGYDRISFRKIPTPKEQK